MKEGHGPTKLLQKLDAMDRNSHAPQSGQCVYLCKYVYIE